MNKLIYIMVFFLNVEVVLSQPWLWSHQIGGPGDDRGGITSDVNNNVYVFGVFEGTCNFITDTLHTNGQNEYFLAKYDHSGNEQWVKSFGGNNFNFDEYAGSLKYDPVGNCIYLTGTFYNNFTFDTFSISSNGGADIYLAKCDVNGNCLWLKSIGSIFNDEVGPFEIDNNGNVVFNGNVQGTATIDSFNISKGGFLTKYKSNGDCQWAYQIFSDVDFGCIKFLNSDILMTGVTRNDTAIIDTSTTISSSIVSVILARFDSVGHVKWVKRNGGAYDSYGCSVGVDNSGYIYNLGYFKDSINFNGTVLTNGNRYDFFLAKRDSSDGSLVWIRQSGATSYASANQMVLDASGKAYIIGSMSGIATFGTTVLSTTNYKDAYIARYDSSGNCLGADNFGGANGYSMIIDNNNDVLVAGDFPDTLTIGTNTFISNGQLDMYFAKRSPITIIEDEERKSSGQLLIYENPNTGTFKIRLPENVNTLTGSIVRIFDSKGSLIREEKLTREKNFPALSVIIDSPGQYSVELINNGRIYSGKVIIQY